MKLYELKRGDWFVLTEEAQGPPDIGSYPVLKCFRLEKIDGMYSVCYDTFGKLCHPAAWSEVEKTEPQ